MAIANEQNSMKKKAILVVSFGTTYLDTLKLAIEGTKNKIQVAFPDYEIRQAFTSRIVIKKLAEQEDIHIDTEQQALERLEGEGYHEVYIQPLHVVAGEEYNKVKGMVAYYAYAKVFERITIGRPLLYYMGQEGKPDDYLTAIAAIKSQLPKLEAQEAIVFMGHGGVHPANTAYAALQIKLEEAGFKNAFVYTVEGFPALDSVIQKLEKNKTKKVTLMPFMLVAGDHATNDMAGDEESSAKSRLMEAGFNVDVYVHGLGENEAIQDIYVQHVKDAMATDQEKKSISRQSDDCEEFDNMKTTEKRAFLLVNLGTAYSEGRQLAIRSIDNNIQSDLPKYEVRQAFTSRALIEKLAECDGIQVDDERRALERLQEEGFTEVIVQPFQIAEGEEYERVRDVVQDYIEMKGFGKIEILPCVTVWAKQLYSMTH